MKKPKRQKLSAEEKLKLCADGNERDWRMHMLNWLESLQDEQIDHGKSIARLEVKAGIWGILGGILGTVAAFFAKS